MVQSLPAHWYVAETIHRRERERIFAGAWWLLGPARDLQSPGSYICDTISGWPVFVVRGGDGVLRGFHNVCRHRAAPILESGAGVCSELRCPYHGWLYDTAGRLVTAPRFGVDAGFDPAEHGLFEVGVDIWRGLVFVCVDRRAPGLAAWLGSVDMLCADFPDPKDLEYYGDFTVRGQANWKTYCDNTVEGYHLSRVHPRLARSLAAGSVEIESCDDGRTVAFHVRYGHRSEGARMRGDRGLWVYRFPGFQLVAGANTFKAERVESIGPRELRSRNWAWYADSPAEDRRDAFAWAEAIVREDMQICERVQQNLQAGVFESGPLSPEQETNVIRLQELVREAVGD